MTFPCNTKLFPLQPEIKYMSMETIYLGIVIFLFVLAIFDLVVGVSNDAVNFLQSAVGAKAASFKTILFIAGIGATSRSKNFISLSNCNVFFAPIGFPH